MGKAYPFPPATPSPTASPEAVPAQAGSSRPEETELVVLALADLDDSSLSLATLSLSESSATRPVGGSKNAGHWTHAGYRH
jgi:hypothetical protein